MVKTSRDFKMSARVSLRGRWKLAVLVSLVASVLGGVSDGGSVIRINMDTAKSKVNLNLAGQNVLSSDGIFDSPVLPFLIGGIGLVFIVALFVGIIYFILGSFVGVGYSKFNLNIIDGQIASFENLFGYFPSWKTAAVSAFLRGLYTFLWSLLFVFPGIVASLSYSMTNYIIAENPYITALEAIERSKNMMRGNKWRLFCLQFSFIGWDFLSFITLGVGFFVVSPYKQAAFAAFYRDISQVVWHEDFND